MDKKLLWYEEWSEIHVMLRGGEQPTYSDEKLGKALREYVLESEHGSWEGFSSRDVTGIRRMLFDLSIALKNWIE